MINSIKPLISRHLLNSNGWSTNRKIVVIESDDWGSIRMPSKAVYDKLLRAGIKVDNCPYCKNDTLASEEDLSKLFESLSKFKDFLGNSPVITANTIVANPDFDKIRESNFTSYHYELFTETLQKYPNHKNAFSLWKEGISNNLFYPQFHGREHLNVPRWMHNLRSGLKETMLAFDHNLFGISTTITEEKRRSYMAALEFDDVNQIEWQQKMVADGLNIFEHLFGYRSQSYIATNYTWHDAIETTLAENGVKFLQGSKTQLKPKLNGITYQRNILGKRNSVGQTYLIRNCTFEPSVVPNKDWYSHCLKEISTAFLWNKPAIISTHRLNFIGDICQQNRDRNIALFEQLINTIIKRWPKVEFMNSVQLGNIITTKK